MGDSWHAFKTGFARTRQKVLAKVGQAEVTKSPEYEEECKKVQELQKTMERVHKNTGKYLEVMKALIAEEEAIAQDISLLAELGGPSLQVARTMEAERDKMGVMFGQYMDAPIVGYMAQFKELKERMDDLEIRRVDMDRYFRDYNAIMAKSNPDQSRVLHIETKYNVTKDGYTALFNEMMEDMPKLIADRSRFFEPMIAAFAKNQASFYTATANAFGTALPSVNNIDDERVHEHKAPITPVESSARQKVPPKPSTNVALGGVSSQKRDYTATPQQPIATYHPPPNANQPNAYSTPPPSSFSAPPSSFSAPPPSSFSTPASPPSQQPVQTPSYAPGTQNPTQNTYSSPPITTPSYPPNSPMSNVSLASPVVSTPTYAPTSTPVSPPQAATPVVSLQKGIKAKANFDFVAQEEDELSFKKGDIVTILNNEGDWWEGELDGARGNLPSNYVTIL